MDYFIFNADAEPVEDYVDQYDLEHEDAYATFEKARKVLNSVRVARGFYPVVALDTGNRKGDSKATTHKAKKT